MTADEAHALLLANPLACEPPLWERPEVCRLGTLDARLTSTCDVSGHCPPCHWEASEWSSSLNGEWRFELFDTPRAALAAAERDELRCAPAVIEVPSAWQLQPPGAADKPLYTNIQYPIDISDPPKMPAHNPTALYARSIRMPEAVALGERRAVLHIAAADNCAFVRAGGRWLAFWKDSRLPAEIELVPDCMHEALLLQIVVLRWSDGAYLEDQDAWKLSGLIRDVYMLFPPSRTSIFDLSWRVVDEDNLQVCVELWQDKEEDDDDLSIEVRVIESGELAVCAADQTEAECGKEVGLDRTNIVAGVAHATITGVRSWHAWSAEMPFLYTVRASLKRRGKCEQCEASYFGKREICVGDDGVLRLNGRRLVVAGVNRHETCPVRGGPSVSRHAAEMDAVLLRRGNFNAVRTAHYPHSTHFLAACDRAGVYVIDEANIETHGMLPHPGYLADHPRWRQAFGSRLKRMLLRDRTHPCVLAWSLGNESGLGAWHRELAHMARTIDPSRLVHYEPATWGRAAEDQAVTDLQCPMYARVAECFALCTAKPRKPLVLCEYCHAMGNSCGGLDEYWRAFVDPTKPTLQGGFIWDMCDQGLWIDREGGFWGYGGDFGELPSDGTFCINGLLLPDRTPKPTWHEAVAAQKPFGDLELLECSDSLCVVAVRKPRLNDLLFAWTIEIEGEVVASGGPPALPNGRRHRSPDELALDLFEPYVLRCNLPNDSTTLGRCWLTVTGHLSRDVPWAKAGHELGTSQLELTDVLKFPETEARLASQPEGAWHIELDTVTSMPSRIFCTAPSQELLAVVGDDQLTPHSASARIFLDLLVAESEVGYGEIGMRGRLGYEGKRVVVAGQSHSRALSAHANSRLVIDLSEAAVAEACGQVVRRLTRLTTAIALNDGAIPPSPQIFKIILADTANTLWSNEATPLTMAGQVQYVDIDASSLMGRSIELVVESKWGRVDMAHAVWLDPIVWAESPKDACDELDVRYRYAKGPVRLCFERAPTDNDRGGYLTFWKAAGLDGPLVLESAVRDGDSSLLTLRPRRVDTSILELVAKLDDCFENPSRQLWESPSGLPPKLRSFAHAYAAAKRLAHADLAPGDRLRIWRGADLAPCTTHPLGSSFSAAQEQPHQDEHDTDASTLTVHNAQPLSVSCRVRTVATESATCLVQISELVFSSTNPRRYRWPSTLPRIGLALRLNSQAIAGQCEWLGRGPHETYPDRKLAGRRGKFAVRHIEDLYTPYIRPSTCANRTDTSRLDLILTSGTSVLRIDRENRDTFDFSLTRHTSSDLGQAMHQHELQPDAAAVHLNLDAHHMGIGGDDSWTACVHDSFLVRPPTISDPASFAFRFKVRESAPPFPAVQLTDGESPAA